MALTLTEERVVAWKIQGVGPDPAHLLVVFKKVGTGKTLHSVLQPGESLKLGWFDSSDDYVAYAISKDENLRHSFSRKYQAVGQIWTFTLHFTLDFQVSEAKTLALKLAGDDPLKRLEEETSRVLSATARHLPWEVLKQENPDFGLHLLESEGTEGLGERRLNFERLQSFATSLGIELQNVEVTRSLTEDDLKIPIKEKEVAAQIGLALLQGQVLTVQEQLNHQQATLQDGHQWDRRLLAAQRKQVLEGMERLKGVLDGIAREGTRAFSQGVDGVRSFAAINDALLEIRTIQSSLMALSAGPGSTPAPALGTAESLFLPGTPTSSMLLAEPRRPSDPLERLATEAFQHLRVLDGNPRDKRRILTTILHLLAEAGLGSERDEEYLEACRENLKQQLYPLESGLEEEPLGFLRRIMDIEKLKQDLGQ